MSNERSGYIDQWRGISVLAVVFYHANPVIFLFHTPLQTSSAAAVQVCITRLGLLGVDTFFVISGFLITQLLLKEENRTGSISLAAFYVRRASRILPPMLIYVLTAMVASGVGIMRLEPVEGMKAVSFLCNTSLVHCAYPFGHFWTLGIEEQFYLVWPLLLVMSGRFRVPLVTVSMIVAATCATISSLVIRDWYNNGLAVYCLASGVLFALSPRFRAVFAAVKRIRTWALLIPLLLLTPVCSDGHWDFGHPVALLAIPPILVCVVLARDGNVLGPQVSEALRKVGLMSYSLYIWDCFGLWHYVYPILRGLSVLAVPLAWVSYRYIELPFIALGRQWSKAILERSISPPHRLPILPEIRAAAVKTD
jgi:peptidoglycan/LPS O-acetylase OafA/YrhL